jgi:hypothetical protein
MATMLDMQFFLLPQIVHHREHSNMVTVGTRVLHYIQGECLHWAPRSEIFTWVAVSEAITSQISKAGATESQTKNTNSLKMFKKPASN